MHTGEQVGTIFVAVTLLEGVLAYMWLQRSRLKELIYSIRPSSASIIFYHR